VSGPSIAGYPAAQVASPVLPGTCVTMVKLADLHVADPLSQPGPATTEAAVPWVEAEHDE
jgi:hypothetical protein